MKKQIFSFGVLACSVVLFSCGNDSSTSDANMSDSSGSMTTTTPSTMDTTSTATTTTTATVNNVGETDKKFMMDAASGGMMEVEAGRLASQMASSERVKAFGNMMVQDHTNANNELKALSSQKNVMLPDSMMEKHRGHITMLKKKTGKEFDKAYMSMMVDDHKEDISKFQAAANNGQDADLKTFASKTLPVLRTHADSANAINNSMKK